MKEMGSQILKSNAPLVYSYLKAHKCGAAGVCTLPYISDSFFFHQYNLLDFFKEHAEAALS